MNTMTEHQIAITNLLAKKQRRKNMKNLTEIREALLRIIDTKDMLDSYSNKELDSIYKNITGFYGNANEKLESRIIIPKIIDLTNKTRKQKIKYLKPWYAMTELLYINTDPKNMQKITLKK